MVQLGNPQAALLETVPGIASVLRSPTADALVRLIRAASGTGQFRIEDARELITFAVRRGLIGIDESERLSAELDASPAGRRSLRPVVAKVVPTKPAKRPVAKKARPKKKR